MAQLPLAHTQFSLPGAPLTYRQQPEPVFAVSRRDWRRIRGAVASLKFPFRWVENVMWVTIPLIPGAALVLLTWLPAYAELPPDAQLRESWVTPAIVVVGLSALVLAVYSYLVARGVRAELQRDVSHVLGDMDEVYQASNPPEPDADDA